MDKVSPFGKVSIKICDSMQTLPPQYRDVLYLVYFENFSIQETCGILKKNAKQVYNLLARARSALKEILMKEGVYNEEL